MTSTVNNNFNNAFNETEIASEGDWSHYALCWLSESRPKATLSYDTEGEQDTDTEDELGELNCVNQCRGQATIRFYMQKLRSTAAINSSVAEQFRSHLWRAERLEEHYLRRKRRAEWRANKQAKPELISLM